MEVQISNERPRGDYVQFIRACYRTHPESFRYFEELVDYILTSTSNWNSSLQQPTTFALGRGEETLPFEVHDGLDSEFEPAITVLEGHLSPECISASGSKLRIRPELFVGHLGLMRRLPHKTPFYELPTLPSHSDNIIHLRVVCLINSPTEQHVDHPTTALIKDRAKAEASRKQAERDLFNERRYGATRVRKALVHSQKLASIEQMVSFTVSSTPRGSWHGLLLMDQGSSHYTDDNLVLPWSREKTGSRPIGSVSIVPYNAPPCFPETETDIALTTTQSGDDELRARLDQFHPLRNIRIRDTIDHRLLLADPYFMFSSLVTVAATSWNMLLNAIDDDIQICEQVVAADRLGAGMQQLRFNNSLISRVELFSAEISHFISAGGSRTWPQVTDSELSDRKSDIQNALLNDQNEIRSRTKYLARRCKAATKMLLSVAHLEESQKGTEQAQQVNDLSRLAFVLIPVSLIVSSFSMHVAELDKEKPPSVWVVFVFAVPTLLVSLTLVFRLRIRRMLVRCFGR